MHEFFKGWRRKVGCALLVVVAAFTVGWVRSTAFADYLGLPSEGTSFFILSHASLLELQTSTPDPHSNAGVNPADDASVARATTTMTTATPWFAKVPPLIWGCTRLEWYDKNIGVRIGGVDVDWKVYDVQWQRRVGRLSLVSALDGHRRMLKFVMPYWIVTIPMMMLSGYLILCKPNQRAT